MKKLTCLLLLAALGAPIATAKAANVPKIKNIRIREVSGPSPGYRLVVTVEHGDDERIDSIHAEVGGLPTEPCVLGPDRRQGSAAFAALPVAGGAAELVLRGEGGKLLASFTGALGPDGYLSLFPAKTNTLDLAVASAFLIGDVGAGGVASLEITGGDVRFVDDSTLSITGGSVIFADGGACSSKLGCDTQPPPKETVVSASVGFGGVDCSGECALHKQLPSGDPIWNFHVWAEAWVDKGGKPGKQKLKTVDAAKGTVPRPWEDGDAALSAVETDEDPLTTLALLSPSLDDEVAPGAYNMDYRATIVSDGWEPGNALPTAAELELAGGPTLLIPVNSYQVTGAATLAFDGDPTGHAYEVTSDGVTMALVAGNGHGTCLRGRCFCLAGFSGGAELRVTGYGTDPGKLPTAVVAAIAPAPLDAKGTVNPKTPAPKEPKVTVGMDPQIAAVFAHTLGFAGDPIGLEHKGKVKLLAENAKGALKKLSKGKFVGSVVRDEDGEMRLAPIGTGGVQGRGDILIGGEPIGIEKVDPEGNVTLVAPPAIVLKTSGNGKGTRPATTASNGKPGLL